MSKIEWTGQTWNPITGCSVISPGCTNCYAMSEAFRLEHYLKVPQYAGTTQEVNGKRVWTGKMNLAETALEKPLQRQKPTMYFVNSMSDLFHEDVPDDWIDHIFAVMALCPQHTFQVLTKRSARMREYLGSDQSNFQSWLSMAIVDEGLGHPRPIWPLPNLWLGVSTENQEQANARIPDLLATPAAIRFVSVEPMLGPVDLTDLCNGHYFMDALRGFEWHDNPDGVPSFRSIPPGPHPRLGEPAAHLNWVICGGESARGKQRARPMHPEWARSLRDRCTDANVPFFFKQWGDWAPCRHELDDYGRWRGQGRKPHMELVEGRKECGYYCSDEHGHVDHMSAVMKLVGKKRAGNHLDGRQHLEMPS